MSSAVKSIPWDGQRITRPGIYANIPLADYHRGDICDGPSLSSTGLRQMFWQSPEHFWDASPLNPLRAEPKDNEDFILGRAAHHLICGEVGFAKLFVVRPETMHDAGKAVPWHGSRKVCKDWLALQKRAGKSVLTQAHVEAIRGMALAIGKHPLARDALNGLIERSMVWKDKETGVWLKARPDCIPTSSGDYSDLKTTQSVLYEDLQYSLNAYSYQQQAALVAEGARALDLEFNTFTLVWVEKARPYSVDLSTLIDADIELGARMNRAAIRKFQQCYTAKTWPGPGRVDAGYLQLSDRARERIESRLKFDMAEAA